MNELPVRELWRWLRGSRHGWRTGGAAVASAAMLTGSGCGPRSQNDQQAESSVAVESLVLEEQPLWYTHSILRDLTADGQDDTVTVTAVGTHPDSLTISLTINTGGPSYHDSWPSSNYQAWDGEHGMSPDWALRQLLSASNFAVIEKPRVPDDDERFVYRIGRDVQSEDVARTVYREMAEHGVIRFRYYKAGDWNRTVAWSPSRKKFYVIEDCC